MSRQRNVHSSQSSIDEKSQIGETVVSYGEKDLKYNHNSSILDTFGIESINGSDILDTISRFGKLIIQLIYSLSPFVIFIYLLQVYQTHTETFYYPNFPNSLTESTIESLNDIGVEFYDLADFKSTGNGWQREERVLFLVPLRDASAHLNMFFSHMENLTYPHNLIDLAFLISDTSDSTIPDLKRHVKRIQASPDKAHRFGRIDIYEKNFGQIVGQSFSDRHGFAAQGPRRKLMAIARNWLLTTALRPDHSWVYWRDADVETVPATIIEDLMHHDKDVIVPNIWRPLPDWLGCEQAYDLNSWQESEGGIELAETLDEDAVIVEGYPEYATWRPHLAYLRDPYGDPEVEIELDGIGGVSILARASVFRQGAMFPAFSFKKHAETEAFGKLCKTMGFNVIGLPHYVIWHIYEPSTDDLKHMEWLANEEVRQRELEKNKVVYDKAWAFAFEDVSDKWREEKFNVFKNTDLSKLQLGQVHWDEVDEYLTEVDDLEEDSVQPNDENFLINLDNTNKVFEQKVLESLNQGPVKYGQSKNELVFGNFFKADGAQRKKQMKFKKFEISQEEQEFRSKIKEVEESTNEEVFHERYDADADKVIVDDEYKMNGGSDEFIDKLISDKTINKDKQLFNDLENKKIDKDGEEGEVEFKSQKPIVLKKATKTGKVQKEIATKTLYEIDDFGATINTVYQYGEPTEAPEKKLTKIQEEVVEQRPEEEVSKKEETKKLEKATVQKVTDEQVFDDSANQEADQVIKKPEPKQPEEPIDEEKKQPQNGEVKDVTGEKVLKKAVPKDKDQDTGLPEKDLKKADAEAREVIGEKKRLKKAVVQEKEGGLKQEVDKKQGVVNQEMVNKHAQQLQQEEVEPVKAEPVKAEPVKARGAANEPI